MWPLIDVHVHVFNALDIPLEGYLRSRRSEKRLREQLLALCGSGLFSYLSDCMRDRCVNKKTDVEKLGVMYRLMLGLASVLGEGDYFSWEKTLSRDTGKIVRELLETYGQGEEAIELFVPLMIDFEYWFKNSEDIPLRVQIQDMYEKIIRVSGGRIHPFVPYDPARELAFRHGKHNPDGELEKDGSLKLVQDAIENKGFVGVKLYNSLGYKPWNNRSTDEQRLRVAVRNEKMAYVFTGEEYDDALADVYDYCVQEEIPITAHCVMGGIESYPGASYDFGSAVFWRKVLEQDRFKKLHLNLAHLGWNQRRGQGYAGDRSWVREICNMMIDYDHLYADISHHRVTTNCGRQKFKRDYQTLRRDFSGENQIARIKKRLLYGSDWHVLKRLKNFENFKMDYIDVLKHEGFYSDAEIEDFLGGNAMNFLGLLPGGKNRQRVERFYRDNDIPEPKWFTSTADLKTIDRPDIQV